MRKPESRYVLKAYSLKEIRSALEYELLRIRDLDVQATDKAMARTHLINAVFLWYLGQPEAERDIIVRAGIEEFQKRIESSVPLMLVLPDGGNINPNPTRGRGLGGVSVKAQKRQAKSKNITTADNH